jgi:hypothetical protein
MGKIVSVISFIATVDFILDDAVEFIRFFFC